VKLSASEVAHLKGSSALSISEVAHLKASSALSASEVAHLKASVKLSISEAVRTAHLKASVKLNASEVAHLKASSALNISEVVRTAHLKASSALSISEVAHLNVSSELSASEVAHLNVSAELSISEVAHLKALSALSISEALRTVNVQRSAVSSTFANDGESSDFAWFEGLVTVSFSVVYTNARSSQTGASQSVSVFVSGFGGTDLSRSLSDDSGSLKTGGPSVELIASLSAVGLLVIVGLTVFAVRRCGRTEYTYIIQAEEIATVPTACTPAETEMYISCENALTAFPEEEAMSLFNVDIIEVIDLV
jgi:hypothetical protein